MCLQLQMKDILIDRLGPDGRLKLTFHIGKMSSQINKISRETFLNDVDTYSHETLLHGYLRNGI